MRGNSVKSLSTKIVLSIILVSIFVFLIIFAIFEKSNKEAFYDIEIEKANIIARTIEPLIALNIYLDMKDNINKIALQLIENPNILAVKVLKNNVVINDIKSNKYKNAVNDSFIVKNLIFQPNSKKKIGTLVLVYSNKNYKDLTDKFTKLMAILLFFLAVLFLLLGLYIKELLSPLRKIAYSLKDYSPNKKIDISFVSQNNEIGLISNALNNMQEKISQYSKKQQDINHYLEEQVDKKTLELRKQLYTNTLTKLPNRLSLLNNIKIVGNNGALLIINVDDFREINDFFGHITGDHVLNIFSSRLNEMFEQEDDIMLNHLSGDEFSLLFKKKPSIKEFTKIAKKLVRDVEKMIFFHENNELAIRITIGGVYQIEKALEKADIALKSAKKQQKSFLLYDEDQNIEELFKENMECVKLLKKAIKEDKIVPYFQPIFDNVTNKIVSCESLIRLIDENNNVISPVNFLIVAKKSRLYSNLTKIMIKKSCLYFEHVNCDFSVNLSVEDILDNETVDYIKHQIKKYNVAKKIIFEILESEGIEEYIEISVFIREMKALGCRIAIDDFGSGYSNFEHILQLNIDYLKIDGSLIKNIDTDTNAQIIIGTIVDFASKLKVLTIAEYVHNEAVSNKVKELNIDRSQGFYLAKPMREIKTLLSHQ